MLTQDLPDFLRKKETEEINFQNQFVRITPSHLLAATLPVASPSSSIVYNLLIFLQLLYHLRKPRSLGIRLLV